ncbi:MAG: hypothetical protein OJF49_002722 [Ktedonobacterales bacterium]|jgi:uncharacterized membrane protein|nr:MAG: hypothetical protein OJF49_002722 [Ktedonobacterales bacterium]
MMTLTIVVQWLHVFLGIFWFGSSLYVDAILIPTLNRLPLKEQQKIGGLIGPRTSQVLVPVGLTVVALGFLRGTVFGPLRSLDAVFGTAYGVTWLIALLLAIGVILWGLLVLKPRAEALGNAKSPEAYGAIVKQLKVMTLVEITGFVAIFTCMILMRFGL